MKGVLSEIGYADALLAREVPEGLMLIDGHLRADTTPESIVPVLILDLTDAEADKLLLTLDPLAALAEADDGKLEALLKSVETESDAVKKLLEDLGREHDIRLAENAVEDEVPEPPANPVTRLGDMWIFGEHRLLCGDSTNVENVARLMQHERAGLMNTDPPYGVSYANDERPNPGVAKPRVANDGLRDQQLQMFLESAFHCAVSNALKPEAAWYLWHAHLTQGFFAAAAAANVVLHRQIIWVKPVLLLGRGQYHWKHEPCFMGWVEGHQPPDFGEGNGERTQTTVWEIESVPTKERKELNHSTPKPVRLFSIPIVKHLARGEVCYEPFAGSGPQYIAAEQHKRKCYGLELNPLYCDVIVERYRRFTGIPAILESTRQTFDQVKAERLGANQGATLSQTATELLPPAKVTETVTESGVEVQVENSIAPVVSEMPDDRRPAPPKRGKQKG